ncbi:AAA family ATPase [uncultured Friedmanniella sp.]|uniref:AAA family ATPase n=1 Tax=uncultured Friedmanniella sp. TaxID=335381 RepID=UPI0035CAA502
MLERQNGRGASPQLTTEQASGLLKDAIAGVQQVIVGQESMVEQLMVGLLAKGHCLLEGVPGVAKTLAVRSFATVVGGEFARIQFTPDLVPSDIVGTRIYKASQETFDVELGPIFVNFVLADEINRAPAKVQAAMLELMAEKQVSIGGTTYPVPQPFIVIATQNPVESEGVYPLPEAQRDRFLLKIDVPYPRGNEEFEILRRMSVDPPSASAVLDPDMVLQLQRQAGDVFVHNLVAEYIVRLVLATRTPAEFNLTDLTSVIQIGCSPRATLGLVAASRALALIHGRDYVLPTDVQAVAKNVMAHRIVLGFDAVADNISAAQVIERIVAMVPPPTPVWNGGQQRSAPQPAPAPHEQPQNGYPQNGYPQNGYPQDGYPQPGNPQHYPGQAPQAPQGQYGQLPPGQYPPPDYS